jgi:hypothetical protein
VRRADRSGAPRRGLDRDDAALFVGFSRRLFDQMVNDGRMPKPVEQDGEEVFDIVKLDKAFNRLSGGGHDNDWSNL